MQQLEGQLKQFTQSRYFGPAIGGVVVVVGVVLIVAFGVFAWMKNDENDDDDGKNVLTPLEIWIGSNNGDDITLKIDDDSDDRGGFDAVRLLDRTLILMPLWALGLVVLGALFAAGRIAIGQALIVITLIAFLLTVYPIFWRALSTSNWESALEKFLRDNPFADEGDKQEILDSLTDLYSTLEFILYALVALLVSGAGLVLHFRYRALNPQPEPPSSPAPMGSPMA